MNTLYRNIFKYINNEFNKNFIKKGYDVSHTRARFRSNSYVSIQSHPVYLYIYFLKLSADIASIKKVIP